MAQEPRRRATPEAEAFVRLGRVTELLSGRLRKLLRPHGLTGPGYDLLRILRGAGYGGLSCREVAERTVALVPDITRLVDRLARLGWVERIPSPADRRVVRIALTAKALDLLATLDAPVERLLVGQFEALAPHEVAELNRLLGTILEAPA